MANGYKPEEYLGLLRQSSPGSFDHLNDTDLLNHALNQRPSLSGELDFSEDILPTEEFDPTLEDHLKKTLFNLKSMVVEVPAAVVGTAAYMLKDPLVKNAVVNQAEVARKWGKDKVDEWVNEDKGIHKTDMIQNW